MGQQQLLLLVLSTVIVGLATVAGIQAFSENQSQATQDALVQRAMSIGTDISAAADQPTQMGGIDLSSDSKQAIASSIGLSSATNIAADGAGNNAGCEITSPSSSTVTVRCDDDGGSDYTNGDQAVVVTVDPSKSNPVSVSKLNGQTVGS